MARDPGGGDAGSPTIEVLVAHRAVDGLLDRLVELLLWREVLWRRRVGRCRAVLTRQGRELLVAVPVGSRCVRHQRPLRRRRAVAMTSFRAITRSTPRAWPRRYCTR